MEENNEVYIASFRRLRIIENLDVPINSTYPLFREENLYYVKGLYFARLKNKFWPKKIKRFLSGPYKNKKQCAFGLIKELSDQNIELSGKSLEKLLNICGIPDYSDDIKAYYFGFKKSGENLDLRAKMQEHGY